MTEILNPYIAGNPITGSEMFFGREDVFDFIHQALTGKHQDNVIVLYGQRRTGKTSVLYQMRHQLSERYLPVFIDLHGMALESLGGFILELANIISRSLRRSYSIELPPLDRDEFAADARTAFETTFLESIWERTGDRQLLLMLDEAVRLEEQVKAGKLPQDVFDYLRHLMQHHPRLNFLFSLGSGLEEMEKEYAFLFNVALYKKISFLDRASAVALITKPVENIYQLEPEAIERILEVTSAHPYFTQLISHGLFNYCVSKSINPVTAADVNGVLDEAVERGLAVLKHVWEESDPAEKAVLSALATQEEALPGRRMVAADESMVKNAWFQLGEDIPRGEIATAIKRLIARDVIFAAPMGGYRFTVELQRMWVQKYRRLDWTQEEIKGWLGSLPVIEHVPGGQRAPVEQKTPERAWFRKPAVLIPYLVLLAVVLVLGILYATNRVVINTTVQSLLGGAPVASPEATDTTASTGEGLSQEDQRVNAMAAGTGLVLAGVDTGLLVFDMDGNYTLVSQDIIGLDCVNDILPVKENTVWLACGGVSEVKGDSSQASAYEFYDRDSGLGMGTVRRLAVDAGGDVWAGGVADSGGSPLSRFAGRSWENSGPEMDPLIDNSDWEVIRSMMFDDDGRLWLGADDLAQGGILIWEGDHYENYTYTDDVSDTENRQVRDLLQDKNGNIWVAASDLGLLNLILDSGEFVHINLPHYDGGIYVVTEMPDGAVYVAGDRYVAHTYDGGTTWDVNGTKEGLGEGITGIVWDENGHIWAGANNLGVSMLEDGAWKPVP